MSAAAVVRTGVDETIADVFAPISEAITSTSIHSGKPNSSSAWYSGSGCPPEAGTR